MSLSVGSVQEGRFGACLMAEPGHVGDCVAAVKAQVMIPVTVKCRIGIDEQDPEEALETFACAVERAGRRRPGGACPQGLAQGPVAAPEPRCAAARLRSRPSPQGRASGLPVVLNGGIANLAEAAAHLDRVDGVMMGRAAYQEPWRLMEGRPAVVRRAGAIERAERCRPGASFPISSASSRAARGFRHYPPHAGAVPRRVRRACLPPSLVHARREAGRRGGCSARRARAPCRARERTGERRGIASSSRAARERWMDLGLPSTSSPGWCC